MKTIFITEKPSVAQEYKKVLKINAKSKTDGFVEGFSPVLNKNVVITWAVGHLIDICPPELQNEEWGGRWSKEKLPMIPKQFKYEPQKNTIKQYRVVKSLYTDKDVNEIYYAGDSGREGIYIQALIRNQIFKTKPSNITEKVVWIDSFTEDEILRGIKEAKPYSHYQPMIDAGYARAIADWLIGMNFTQGFTLTSNKLINTGRVMTPTLAMVVKRQEEIDNFVKTDYYGIKANDNIYWTADENSRYFNSPDLYNENGFIKKAKAEELLNEFNKDKKLKVENVKVQEKKEYAPYLFNLADLQNYCSKMFKISPAQTLSYAQSLYEKKLTTYPRTDSRFLSTAVAKDYMSKGYSVPKRYVDDSKVTDHYAIVPTFYGKSSSLDGLEKKVYDAILRRFMDTLKPPYVYDSVSVVYVHSNKEHFYETFKKVKQYGFKAKAGEDGLDIEKDEDENDKEIPQKGSCIKTNFEIRNLETKPPVSYTTGSLIMAMEKAGKLIEDEELREQIKTCGIGTSATRAAIIEKLAEKQFIKIDNKQKVMPTEFGKAVIPVIAKADETLISPVKTADMESSLHAIAEGKLSLNEYIKFINEYVSSTTKAILSDNKTKFSSYNNKTSKSYKCPCCDREIKLGRYGWYCECKFSLGLEVCGHKMKETDLEDLITKGKTKLCSFTSKQGKKFKARLVLNKTLKKAEFEFERG